MSARLTREQLEREIERLRKLAYTDELTGLYNRHGFKELAGIFLREASIGAREKRGSVVISELSVLMFDLDRFKSVNDTYGHDAGDRVLARVGKVIRDRVREIDVPARWGGEELVLALVGASEADAARIAESLRRDIEKARIVSERKRIPVTTSVGVAAAAGERSIAELLKRADQALYAAKRGGRNRVVRWSELADEQ